MLGQLVKTNESDPLPYSGAKSPTDTSPSFCCTPFRNDAINIGGSINEWLELRGSETVSHSVAFVHTLNELYSGHVQFPVEHVGSSIGTEVFGGENMPLSMECFIACDTSIWDSLVIR